VKRRDEGSIEFEFNGRKVTLSSKDFRELPRKVGRRDKPMTASQKETLDLFCSFVSRGLGKEPK
jgi:hypothetical protein